MSVAVSTWAWEQAAASPGQKLVLVKLADSANDDGVCWPSLRTLERHLGMGKSSVQRHVKGLVEAGLLTVEVRKHTSKRRRSNLYRLSASTLSHSGGTTSEEVVPLRAGQPLSHSGRDIEPSLEPSLETKAGASPSSDDPIGEVYAYWRAHRDKARSNYSEISEARRKKLASRLREFSVEDLKRAIDGVACDPWIERAKHDDLTIIFRSREQVEKFIDLAEQGSPRSRGLSPQEIARRAVELEEEEAA